MEFKLRTPNSELKTISRERNSFDEILLQLIRIGLPAQPASPRKVLFWGEGADEISSYVAGWMAGKGIDVIVLDGANRFDPYMVSSFAKKASMPPVSLLKRIRIARAFTCYQMAALIEERLVSLLKQKGEITQQEKPWVILLGLITPFLDEDVSEREVRPLFERSLRKVEGMATGGIPFFLFQPSNSPSFPPFVKGGRRRPERSDADLPTPVKAGFVKAGAMERERPDYGAGRLGGLRDSKRAYLMKRLFQFSDLIWRISLDDQGPTGVLEKSLTENHGMKDLRLRLGGRFSLESKGCG